jgi:hypothetical protein
VQYGGGVTTKPRARRRLAVQIAALVLGAMLPAGCGDSAVAAIRLDLQPDFSGSITASSLLVPEEPGPTEALCTGAQWQERATLYCAHGQFQSVSELAVADIRFEGGTTPAGFSYLKVTLPRGEAARWLAAMAPAKAERAAVERAFDPRRELGGASEQVAVEVDVPGPIVSNGVTPHARGVATDHTSRRAQLLVPVDRALEQGEPWVWLVTWK